MTDTTETELTETQKAYNVAQYELFQLAAYGHCTYTNGELLTKEGQRQQADYNDRIRAAREELEAALLRLVAEHAETVAGSRMMSVDWLRSLANDPAMLSLLAVRPDEREAEAASVVVPAADLGAVLREAADQIDQTDLPQDYVDLFDSGAHWATAQLRLIANEAPRRVAAETPPAETEAHPPTTTWKVESPRRSNWASWGATYDERDWAQERYESATANAPARPFRLVRATTTYTVEAEHTPAVVVQPGKDTETPQPKEA